MIPSGERAYKRPRRLLLGVSRGTGKPIYCEGFGEWERVVFPLFDEDSDGSLPDSEDSDDPHQQTLFWWKWNLAEVLAEELQIAEEDDYWHEEALRQDQEEAEHLQHLMGSQELDVASPSGSHSSASGSFEEDYGLCRCEACSAEFFLRSQSHA